MLTSDKKSLHVGRVTHKVPRRHELREELFLKQNKDGRGLLTYADSVCCHRLSGTSAASSPGEGGKKPKGRAANVIDFW